jgi:CubicO group peptidase (beta-lactamase class C family)
MLPVVFGKRTIAGGVTCLRRGSAPATASPLRRLADGRLIRSNTFVVGDVIEQLVDDMPELMARSGVPGASLSLLRGRQPIWSGSFGVTRKHSGGSVGPDTLFQAASLSKPVFAYVVLELIDQGALELDRPLTRYWPNQFALDDPLLDRVTARHVLGHTTGWPNWRPAGGRLRRTLAPGERFGYSGEGHVYLQQVVEHLTGESLATLAQRRVFDRFGMLHSSFAGVPVAAHIATGHDGDGAPLDSEPAEHPNAASSLLSTPIDFARFMSALLVRLDASATLGEMMQPQVSVDDRVDWGLGWGLELHRARRACWQWGDNSGYKSFAIAELGSGAGTVIMTNGDGGRMLYTEVVRALLGPDQPALDWLERRYQKLR